MLPFIARVNEIRRENPALQHLSGVAWLETANDQLMAYVKQHAGNAMIVRRQPRPAPRAGGQRDHPGAPRPAAGVRRHRPAVGRALRLAHRAQLRAPRPVDAPGAHPARRAAMSEPGHWFEAEPLWFKTAVFYEIHIRGFFDGNGDGSGDFRGLTEKLDYLQWLGIDCIWLLPFYKSPLRDGGYDIADYFADPPRLRRRRGRARLHRAGAPARHPRDRRPRHEPHVERSPVVPGVALEPRQPQARLVRLVGHRAPLRGRADHLRRHRDVELDLGRPGRRVLLAPLLLAPARPQLRQPRGPGRDARGAALLARPRARRLPARRRAVPVRARGDDLREPARDARLPQARARRDRRELPGPRAAGRGEPVAGRRRRLLRRRRRVPDVLPLPGHAAHVHERAPGRGQADVRDPRPDAGDPRQLPVGPVPAQPRRADARDGHRRGARLHVHGVRQGPAHEDQRRASAGGSPRCSTTGATRSS